MIAAARSVRVMFPRPLASGRWQAEARPTNAGTRVVVVGQALSPANRFFSPSLGSGCMSHTLPCPVGRRRCMIGLVEAGMKRAILCGGLAGAVLLIGQGEDARVFVNFQEVMIPMRDGVRLETVLLTPKNAKGALPFLIDRTPYGVPGKGATEPGGPAGRQWGREDCMFAAR